MQNQEIAKYQSILESIDSAQNILLITHFNPDGDGISSLCSMMNWLLSIGKMAEGYCLHQPPAMLGYLPGIEKIKFGSIETLGLDFEKYDIFIVLDCGSLSRTGIADMLKAKQPRQKIIEIDHHPKIDDYADIELRSTEAAATAELVYQFYKINHIKITKDMAMCLLTGILTDTANFFYPSTSIATVSIAADLILRGARLPQITENTLRNKSLNGLKLWGQIMANIRINPKYDFAVTILPQEEREKSTVPKEELDGISGFLSNLYGVKGILFLQEEADGSIRGNLRTASPLIDISKLARLLGGGGHPKAAGFSIKGRLVDRGGEWQIA
ncbi:bifunctional oligoribonuclease/PAP phosphatase NrnA [Candidatus Falkowbacteria bacterium]|nr:bifunctional oligoribonuclease/PAP phosphatase NrnA [Candidatus Falkowbacteria bacterium]